MRGFFWVGLVVAGCGAPAALLAVDVKAVREPDDKVTLVASLACVSAYQGDTDPGCNNDPTGFCVEAIWSRKADASVIDRVENCSAVTLAGAQTTTIRVTSNVAIPKEPVSISFSSIARRGTTKSTSGASAIDSP